MTTSQVSEHERDALGRLRAAGRRSQAEPGKVLEIGCAAGWLLAGRARRGLGAYGIEASPKFADHARDTLGLKVHCGTLDDCRDGATT